MSQLCGSPGQQTEHVCERCKKTFVADDDCRNVKYCPKPCRAEARKEKQRNNYRAKAAAKAAAR